MAPEASRRLLGPLLLWLGTGALALGLFIVWASEPDLLNEELSIWTGALACLVSGGACTEVVRRALDPRWLVLHVGIYLVGLATAAAVAFVYALFFAVFHAPDF
jgi:hypothetical protein